MAPGKAIEQVVPHDAGYESGPFLPVQEIIDVAGGHLKIGATPTAGALRSRALPISPCHGDARGIVYAGKPEGGGILGRHEAGANSDPNAFQVCGYLSAGIVIGFRY